MKTYNSIIFDFNGTLFWDTPYHNLAWDRFLENHRIRLTDQEKNIKIHGKMNQDILRGLFHENLNHAEMDAMIEEKETIYQQICLQNKMELAPGAVRFLDFLMNRNIPCAIATASEKSNVHFYCKYLHLETWFSTDRIIYNDRTFRGKPHPDIFILALQKINAKPGETIIFEDSFSGIKAAENAGAGKIIIVNSIQQNYMKGSHQIITSFDEVNRKLLK